MQEVTQAMNYTERQARRTASELRTLGADEVSVLAAGDSAIVNAYVPAEKREEADKAAKKRGGTVNPSHRVEEYDEWMMAYDFEAEN